MRGNKMPTNTSIKRLPCENLDDFIQGTRVFYTLYEQEHVNIGDEVELFHEDREHLFTIQTVFCYNNRKILGLTLKD